MKRSEAVSQLAKFLSTYVWYEERDPEELLGLAEDCIKGVEKIGMLPPTYNNYNSKFHQRVFASECDFGRDEKGQYLTIYGEWEEE